MRRRIALFGLAALAAALAPFMSRSGAAVTASAVAWPTHHEGRALTALPLSPREAAFLADFPGQVGRFTDGEREIIVRRIDGATRRLHPAADCLRAIGYRITPLPAQRAAQGGTMNCVRASRDGESQRVCEIIRDQAGHHWPDVSAWYWSALAGASAAPWWSFVVAEAE